MYKVPSMKEIEAIPWNGYKVISTFSGGGGSCLGYRMAGFKVVYANEFVEEAQNTYRANHPNSYLDTRDIRTVTPESILEIAGLKKGELDLFDGSPPCSAFSLAGKREKSWGKEKCYSDTTQRVDDLFFEYIRIMNGLQPKVFIAENVKGLVLGKAKGYFKRILHDMKECGYEVKAAVVMAAYCGVPQLRPRVIFCGVRKDIAEKYDVHPAYPIPMKHVVTLGEALQGVENDPEECKYLFEMAKKYKWGDVLKKMPKNPKKPITGQEVTGGSYFNLVRTCLNRPCHTFLQTNGKDWATGVCHPIYDRKMTVAESKRITSVPDDFILTGDRGAQVERLGRMVPPLMMKRIAETVKEQILDKARE